MCCRLKEFLPKEYVKNRGVEKRIFLEHKTLAQLNEVEAKVQYNKKCRALPTYGVTFFLVKVSRDMHFLKIEEDIKTLGDGGKEISARKFTPK